MAGKQSAQLERKKFFADPIMVSMIVVLLVFLALFILYPLLMLLVDSFYAEGTITLDVFKTCFKFWNVSAMRLKTH